MYFFILLEPPRAGKKAQEAKRRATGDSLTMKEDEMEMNVKRRKAKEAANQKYDNLVKASIKGAKRENMQSQDMLRAEMQMAYKQGALFLRKGFNTVATFFFFFLAGGAACFVHARCECVFLDVKKFC